MNSRHISRPRTGLLLLIALGVGLWIGSNTYVFRDTPVNATECVMHRLGDMQSDAAADHLMTLCRLRYGDFDRSGQRQKQNPFDKFDGGQAE